MSGDKFNGVLVINKSGGMTSHDVVGRLRRLTHQKKIGHAGTLDPDATGVLIVCLGSATRLSEYLTGHDKEYRCTILLGTETDTQDISGRITAQHPADIGAAELEDALASFTGETQQIPPMYSAIRHHGRHLYELARAGETVERAPRTIRIEQIHPESIHLPEATFTVTCSKGTYIRTLCHDIGRKLGCGACMKALERIRSGSFGIEEAVTLDGFEQALQEGRAATLLHPADEVFADCPSAQTGDEGDHRLYNGNVLQPHHLTSGVPDQYEGRVRVYDSAGHFQALYRTDGGQLRPERMFLDI